jgi:hypothetical protein
LTKGSVRTVLKELEGTQYGEHIMIIHPRVSTLSKAYSRYTKNQLVNNNEVVLMIPYYKTPDQVKNNLSTKGNGDSDGNNNNNNNSTSIDIEKHSKEGSLIIMDGVKAHFRPDSDIKSFINELEKHAKSKGKKGISVFVDMASHYHFGNPDDVVHHELSLPSRYHNMNIKRFCVYHEKDFGRLQEEQKQVVRKHHGKELQITEPA